MNEEQLKLHISEWSTPYFAFLASIILEGLLSLCCRLDDFMNSQQSWTLRTYPEVLLLKSVSFFAVTCVLHLHTMQTNTFSTNLRVQYVRLWSRNIVLYSHELGRVHVYPPGPNLQVTCTIAHSHLQTCQYRTGGLAFLLSQWDGVVQTDHPLGLGLGQL